MMAAWQGHSETVKLLLSDNGANVNATRIDGVTALMLASENGYAKVVRLLLEAGADINAAKFDGATALMLASQIGNTEVVRILLNHGAKVNAACDKGITPSCWLARMAIHG